MSGARELKPLVRRMDRQMVLAQRKLDRTLSMLEVLIVQLVEPVTMPEQWTHKLIAREEIYRAEALLRVIESRLRRLVVQPGPTAGDR